MAKISLHKIRKFVDSQGICFILVHTCIFYYATFLWSEPYVYQKINSKRKSVTVTCTVYICIMRGLGL